jgi:hypothetical protein
MAQKFFKSSFEEELLAKKIAQESEKTERDRKKIAKLLSEEESLHTQENIEKAKKQNRERLYRQTDRLPVDSANGLFDCNQNPEEMSIKIKKMADTLREFLEKPQP